MSNIKKLGNRTINDITTANKGQIPASRGSNPIKFIVVHYLGVPNADNPYLYGGGYGGHYNIKRDGSIYLAANPKTAVVWQCGGGLQGSGGHSFYQVCTNYNSIGIECGVAANTTARDLSGDSGLWYFTEETQESLVWLVSKLMDEYGISFDHVIRHYDVTGKICPNPYVKNNNYKTSWTWTQFKNNLAQYRKDGTITIPNGNSNVPDPVVPTPTPTVQWKATGTATSTVDDLNFRDAPDGNIIGVFNKGNRFEVDGTKNGRWIHIKSGNKIGYVYDSYVKYDSTESSKPAPTPSKPNNSSSYMVKITADALNIRSGPGTNYNINGVITDQGIYTIVQESGTWGKLKSGAGWISLKYTKKV